MPTIKRVGWSQASVPANFPGPAKSNLGGQISAFGDAIVAFAKKKKDIEDTIEANRLLADHAIKAQDLQNEILRSDMPEDKIVGAYQQKLEELNQQTLDSANSEEVKNALESTLPGRNASKVIQMQQESNRRFSAKALSDYQHGLQVNGNAYATATTDEQRKDIRDRNLNLIDLLQQNGVFSAQQAEVERQKWNRKLDLFDIERDFASGDPAKITEMILHPEKVLKDHPGTTIEDFSTIVSGGIKQQQLMQKQADRKRKEAREQAAITLDSLAIRGKLTFDDIAKFRPYISDEENRRLLETVNKQYQAGGIDDPAWSGQLGTDIRLDPYSTTPGDILSAKEHGHISRDTANDLLDLRERRIRQLKTDAESPDPRLKGPLFSEGKSKINQVVGHGITIRGMKLDSNTERRWAAAIDEYYDRVMRETDKSQIEIANDVIKKFEGPAKPGEITPFQYRDAKSNPLTAKLARDIQREKDPQKRKELLDLMRRIRSFYLEQKHSGEY